MAYEIIDVNGHKVHTGGFTTSRDHLDSLHRVPSTIADIYFCRRTQDGVEEKVLYSEKSIRSNKSGLGITIRSPSGENATLHVGGLDNIKDILSDLEVGPESLAMAVGREVNAYRDSITLYGIGVPTFARKRRVTS